MPEFVFSRTRTIIEKEYATVQADTVEEAREFLSDYSYGGEPDEVTVIESDEDLGWGEWSED